MSPGSGGSGSSGCWEPPEPWGIKSSRVRANLSKNFNACFLRLESLSFRITQVFGSGSSSAIQNQVKGVGPAWAVVRARDPTTKLHILAKITIV